MDPNNHNVIWVGTGENNHQRALGYGDGVYKSIDGGKSWKNMGLKESRQIGGNGGLPYHLLLNKLSFVIFVANRSLQVFILPDINKKLYR